MFPLIDTCCRFGNTSKASEAPIRDDLETGPERVPSQLESGHMILLQQADVVCVFESVKMLLGINYD